MGDDAYGINEEDVVTRIVSEVAEITRLGVQVGVVIGGGNIFRGMKGRPPAWTAPPPTTWACWPR